MKKAIIFLALYFLLPLLAAAQEVTEENKGPWSADTNISFFSEYMFRGFNLYDGAAIQPSVMLNYDAEDMGVFHMNVWMHLPGESSTPPDKFSEMDLTFTYDYTFEPITISFGHVSYFFLTEPDGGLPETAEFFTSLSVDTFLTPTFSVYHDYRAFDAQYYELLLSHKIETPALGEGFNVTPFVNFGFASHAEKLYADNGFVQTTVGIYSETNLGDITLIPSLNYTIESDETIEDEFWLGLSFSYSFQ